MYLSPLVLWVCLVRGRWEPEEDKSSYSMRKCNTQSESLKRQGLKEETDDVFLMPQAIFLAWLSWQDVSWESNWFLMSTKTREGSEEGSGEKFIRSLRGNSEVISSNFVLEMRIFLALKACSIALSVVLEQNEFLQWCFWMRLNILCDTLWMQWLLKWISCDRKTYLILHWI